jgi:hypothetical protein
MGRRLDARGCPLPSDTTGAYRPRRGGLRFGGAGCRPLGGSRTFDDDPIDPTGPSFGLGGYVRLRPIADVAPAVTLAAMSGELTEHDLERLNLGQRARGWIVNSYAQFEHLLLVLVVRAKASPEYAALRFPYRTDKRITEVRRLCAMQGPLEAFSVQLTDLLDRFEAFESPRLLLVHGFCAVSIDGAGNMSFNFKRYRLTKDDPTELEERTFTLSDLQIERNAFVQFAREAVDLFVEIYGVMGWEGLHLPDPVQ